MQLIGFEGMDASPFWYQDYHEKDNQYNNVATETDYHAVLGLVTTVDRFKAVLDIPGTQYYEHRIPDERLTKIKNYYLCLTLGFNMLDITVTAKGLLGAENGRYESALFKVIRHGASKEVVYDLLLIPNEKDEFGVNIASKTLKNMPWGTYSVIPNDQWNWTYDPLEPKDHIRIGETPHYTFTFDMKHKSVAGTPQHDERQPKDGTGDGLNVVGGFYNGSTDL